MDRRTVVSSILGLTGAGATLSWARLGFKTGPGAAIGAGGPVAPAQPPIRIAGTGLIKAVSIAQVPIGAGGFVTGLDLSANGKRLACRTDACNAYVRDLGDAAWRPLFSPLTMRPADYDPLPAMGDKADAEGVAGIRIAPSNPDVIFASYYGFVWKSVDGGKSIARTRLPQKAMLSNGGWQRLFNRTIDIHPRDPNRVIVGTWGDGVWFTADGGEHWDQARLPQSGKSRDDKAGIFLVAFDPTAADRVYVFVTGVGLFRSDTGPGGDFGQLPGGPTLCSSLVVSPDGTLYLCEQTKQDAGGKVFRYSPAAGWASSTPDHEMLVIAVDPHKPSRLVAADPNGYFTESLDGGKTFRSIGGVGWKDTGEIAWMRGLKTMFPAQILIDLSKPDQVWVAQGVGVAKVSTESSKYMAEDWSSGIEELVAITTLCVPGGKTFLAAWDKSFWRVDDLTAYRNGFTFPMRAGRSHDASLVAFASYLDYAGDDPQFVVGVVAPSADTAPGFTTNGGDSWQAFESEPASGWGYGGVIAASTKRNIVVLPSNNGVGVFTLDGGASWSPIKLDGVTPTGGFSNAYYVKRKNLAADKTRPGTFALLYTVIKNDAYGNPLGGFWVTRDGGKSWNQILKGVISAGSHDPASVRMEGLDERQFWDCQIEYVPKASGELVYTPHSDFKEDRFYWSRDDGQSWAELHKKVRNVRSFGFGKSASGQVRPAVYFWGEIDAKPGLYVSFDWFATLPQLLTRFPSQMLSGIISVTGDPDRFGRAYLGTSAAGWIRIEAEI